jgi:hopanoid-associated phosphorylase
VSVRLSGRHVRSSGECDGFQLGSFSPIRLIAVETGHGFWEGGINSIVTVSGLDFEAGIAAGEGVTALYGLDRARLAVQIGEAVRAGGRGIVSFGTAGGLAPDLMPGTVIVARDILSGGERMPGAAEWAQALLAALPHARHADIAGADEAVAGVEGKRALWGATGAAVVDMESHGAYRIAAAHSLPFAALRVVLDPAHRALPPAALAAMRSDGTSDILAVLRSLARRPGQLPDLIRLASDANKAKAALLRSRRVLAPGFGFPGFQL